jgi:hypothetical protein
MSVKNIKKVLGSISTLFANLILVAFLIAPYVQFWVEVPISFLVLGAIINTVIVISWFKTLSLVEKFNKRFD